MVRFWRRGAPPTPPAETVPPAMSKEKEPDGSGTDKPHLALPGVPAAIEVMGPGGGFPTSKHSSNAATSKGSVQGEELSGTVMAQRSATEDLQRTIEAQHNEIRRQRCMIEVMKGHLRAVRANTPEGPAGPAMAGWDEEGGDEEPGRAAWEEGLEGFEATDMDQLTQAVASQILEKLHLAEDKYRAQEEEINLLELALESSGAEVSRLMQKINRDQKLILALKKELSGLRKKLRDHTVSSATMEVEIERYKVEKRALSKMMSSQGMDDASTSTSYYLQHSGSDSPTRVAPVSLSPERPGSLHHFSSVEGTPDPSSWSYQGSPEFTTHLNGSGSKHQQIVAEGEIRSLVAQVEAAREVAQSEAQRRAAVENELDKLKALIQDKERQREHQAAGGDADSEDAGSVSVAEATSLVLKEQLSSLRDLNPSFQSMWQPSTTEFKVRGKTYMTDGVKVDATVPLFELIHMELFDVQTDLNKTRVDNLTGVLKEVDSVYSRVSLTSQPPFLLVINFQVPGVPSCSVCVYFALNATHKDRLDAELKRAREQSQEEQRPPPPSPSPSPVQKPWVRKRSSSDLSSKRSSSDLRLGAEEGSVDGDDGTAQTIRLLADFLLSNDDEKNARFKLVPSVIEGPWIVKTAVGNKPVILGKKVTQRYSTGPGYLEVDVDIGSSSIASRVLALVRDYSKNIVVELAVLLQGEKESELPERILGSVRFSNVDWALAEKLSSRCQLAATSPRVASP